MKNDFSHGSADLKDFWYWMNTRHEIHLQKEAGAPKPWTEDEIFQKYKFTNVFRQLDKTTVALHENILRKGLNESDELVLFNVVWFRMFGWIGATEIGFLHTVDELDEAINGRYERGEQLFTGAYMSWGGLYGEPKHLSYLRVLREFYDYLDHATAYMKFENTLESAFDYLLTLKGIGKFFAYEMACDLRFTGLLCRATDINSWANIGPGAKRGLQRLGAEVSIDSMIELYKLAKNGFFRFAYDTGYAGVPFELREIEHSLCEFDKYQRILRGEGRPKEKYNGRE